MRFGSVVAVMAVLMLTAANRALAAVCLDKSMTLEDIVEAISASPGCGRAMKIFEDCELGASGDAQLGAAVERKCEADFLPWLSPSQKKAYASELSRCDVKYRNKDGTMYRSFTAFCRAKVSQRYSRKSPRPVDSKAR